MTNNKSIFDIIVTGGGLSGVTTAILAARQGYSVLIVEKNSFLGGTPTGALVSPMMKNALKNGENLTCGIYDEILQRLSLSGNSATFKDGNPAWFNPIILKCVLDDLCEEENIDILFDSYVISAQKQENKITSINVVNKSGISELKAKYFIDATGDADLAAFAGVPFETGNNGVNQAMSLRFTMTNINLTKFAEFLMKIDPDSGVSTVEYKENSEILLHTAYTWDDKDWKLKPYFEKGIKDGILKPEDTAYFQVFSIPGQKTSLTFNCPRIYAEKPLNTLDAFDLSYAYKMGRKQLRRIADFCVKYLPGFDDAFISEIAPMLGIRDSRRIKGKYTLTEYDVAQGKKFENPVARSNYPVDVHSNTKNKSELTFLKDDDYYEIPLECLMPVNVDNLLVVGRCISATFKAQASLRIIPNCISMGEAAGKYVSEKLKTVNKD